MGQRVFEHSFRAGHQAVVAGVEAAGDDFEARLDFAGQFINRDDGEHDAVFAEVTAVFNYQILNHVGAVAGIDADAAHIDFPGFARAEFVKFQNVAAFNQHDFAD